MNFKLSVATLLMLVSCSERHGYTVGALATQDRIERRGAVDRHDWSTIALNDAKRREAVRELLVSGQILSATDYCDAATIYQRSSEPGNLKLSFAFATLCAEFEAVSNEAARLQTTTWDRYMLSMGSGQWYGTQFTWLAGGQVEMLPLAPHLVGDEDRARYGLPSLSELSNYLRDLNDHRIVMPIGELPAWVDAVAY